MGIDQVIKRDGRRVPFDRKRIENAIYAAARAVGNGESRQWAETLSWAVTGILEERFGREERPPHVEEIQDIVEEVLIKSGHPQIAKAYILYRQKRAEARAAEQMLLDTTKLVDDYLDQTDWRVSENSNMNYSLQGLNFYLASSIAARYWLHKIYPPEVQKAHIEGDLHIHDLGMLSSYCAGWDLQDLLIRGFGGVPAKIESRPPRHLRTALGQLVNFFYTLQGEVAGAVAVSNFDTLLAPFIRYDRLDEAGVRQAVQEFVYNINVPTRVGFQTPFTNLTMDLTPPSTLRDQPVIIGGKPQEATYGEFQPEMDLLNRAFAEIMLEGDARGRVFSVDYASYVLVREKGEVRLVPIGEYIDGKMATASPSRIEHNQAEVLDVGDLGIETIGIQEGKVGWQRVRYLVRHPADQVLKITTVGGFNVSVTPAHSVLVLRNGEIVACEAGHLEPGDYLLSPRTLQLGQENVSEISLAPALAKINPTGRIPIVASGLETVLKAILEREPVYRDAKNRRYRNSLRRIKARYGIATQKTISVEGARRIIGDAEQMGIVVSPALKSLVEADLIFLRVRSIQKQPTTTGMVYDFSTDSESFLANQILVHNTFPIPTYNITRDFNWENPALEPIWDMTARYGIPYWGNYINSDMRPEDARSMCPLHPDTEVIVRGRRQGQLHVRTIHDVYHTAREGIQYEVLFNGRWLPGRVVSVPTEGCREFTLSNGTRVALDLRHEQPVKRGRGRPIELLTAAEIREGMYLPFNATPLGDQQDNYDAGFAVGAFLGDGSYDEGALNYALNNEGKEARVARRLHNFFTRNGFAVSQEPQQGQVVLLRVGGSGNVAEAWMAQFVAGRNASQKALTARAFQMGHNFLRGILDGWYATDGGNRGRIYTISEHLCRDFAILCGLLGLGYRVDLQGDARAGRYEGKAFTLKFHNRTSYGRHFFYEDGFWWYPVVSIRPLDHDGLVYCFAVDSEEHLFQLANGLITHNCRLRLDNRELRRRLGGLFAAAPLTGSVGVVTINLPRLAYLAEDEADFHLRLERLMEIARTSLEIKRKMLENLTERGLYPYSRHYLEAVKRQTGAYWSNHFSTIGLLGMNEACLNLLGVGIAHPEGKALAVRTLNFMRQVISRFQEETGNLYNLEATPAEGASYRLARADRKRYPNIRTAGTPETPYYTNSTHLPVSYSDDLFEVLEHQDELQTLYTGGTVLHIFLGERLHHGKQARRLVRLITENYRLPYFTITPTFSICPVHGYIPGEHFYCPYEHTAEELARYGV